MFASEWAVPQIARALQSGRAGRPVAARIISYTASTPQGVEEMMRHWSERLNGWFPGSLLRRRPLRSPASEECTELLLFSCGASALLSTAPIPSSGPLLDVVLWGTQGTITGRWGQGKGDWQLGEAAAGEVLPERVFSTGHVQSPRPPYGVLLVAGEQTHQAHYAPAFERDERCRLVGVTDQPEVDEIRQVQNRRLAERLEIPYLPDFEQALRRDDVQIVSLCAEPRRRGPLAVRAALAGKHLYLDKPLAARLDEAQAITEAAQTTAIITQMFSLVRSDALLRARRAIQQGTLGTVQAMHFDVCFAKGPAGTVQQHSVRRESAEPDRYEFVDAKRELTNVGVYPLTACLWMLGRPVRRVAATTGNYFFLPHQTRDVEDFGQLVLQTEDDIVVTVSAGRTGWNSHPDGGIHRVVIRGAKGVGVFDVHQPRVTVWNLADPWQAPAVNPEDPMGMWASPQPDACVPRPKQNWFAQAEDPVAADVRHFLDCVQHQQPSDVPAELGAEATKILLAAYRSAAQGQTWEVV